MPGQPRRLQRPVQARADDRARAVVRPARVPGALAVLRAQRPAAVRVHGRRDHIRNDVRVQRLRAGDQLGPVVVGAGRGRLRLHQVRRPRPVRAPPVPGHAVRAAPVVRRPQLRHADRVDRAAVFRRRVHPHHQPGRHRHPVPHHHPQHAVPRPVVRVQLPSRLDAHLRHRGVRVHRQRVHMVDFRLLPGHHVFRAQRPVPYHVHRLRDAWPSSLQTVATGHARQG